MLRGEDAKRKARLVDREKHYLLEASHPSPMSANRGLIPFLGCNHFSICNELLISQGKLHIDWSRL